MDEHHEKNVRLAIILLIMVVVLALAGIIGVFLFFDTENGTSVLLLLAKAVDTLQA